ncbi:hypothetical protein FOZ62_032261 [Perkinsus olseni]|uniref:Uncharacterized protein n=2 Tax=Perkinsus olseni TaxID=32597 RepID=A0A7J6SIH3_PEROL|nr:hypothetical protein FOZ62_032261 [Perkinsus olseni]
MVTSAGYREMKKLRREAEAANYEKTRTLIFGRFRRANSSAPLWIGDPAVYAAIYSTNPSVNPFFPGPFEPGGPWRSRKGTALGSVMQRESSAALVLVVGVDATAQHNDQGKLKYGITVAVLACQLFLNYTQQQCAMNDICCFPMAPVGTAAELWAADLKQAQATLQDVVRECDGTLRAAATGGRSQDGVGTAIAVTRGRIAQLRHLHSHLARGLSNLSTEPEA